MALDASSVSESRLVGAGAGAGTGAGGCAATLPLAAAAGLPIATESGPAFAAGVEDAVVGRLRKAAGPVPPAPPVLGLDDAAASLCPDDTALLWPSPEGAAGVDPGTDPRPLARRATENACIRSRLPEGSRLQGQRVNSK